VKVAIVHNDYGKFSGEEAVVRDHADVLTAQGCDVVFFRCSSAELKDLSGNLKGFVCGIWNPFARHCFAKFLDREKPDIVHIHNLYPLINPCILPEAKRRNIPVVMTVHNFRLFCPNGLFAVNNTVCEECAQKQSVQPCIRKNCLQSRLKTLGYALRTRTAQHFGWYKDNVDRFLCLTEFQRDKLISYGVPQKKCAIVPNFIDAQWLRKAKTALPGKRGYVAYMGRLSEEKGIDILLDAARALPSIPFKIAGNGAESYRTEASANVDFVGYLTGEAQFEFMRNARLQVMTSRCYENFPTTLLQGMSLGIPAIVPASGGMPGIIGKGGTTFVPGDSDDLCRTIQSRWNAEDWYTQAAVEARNRTQKYYSPDIVGKSLLDTYQELTIE